jgi:hypothetical protein
MYERVKRFLIGAPRDIRDPRLFHKVSLVAFLAWVGLGADGLSSSAYGPDEAFRALVDPVSGKALPSLAIFLAASALIMPFASKFTERFLRRFDGQVSEPEIKLLLLMLFLLGGLAAKRARQRWRWICRLAR